MPDWSYWSLNKRRMIESAVVISSKKEFAMVKVYHSDFCNTCSARTLCFGEKRKKGIIIVRNPISAESGDAVEIKIPEEGYNKELIQIFGILLLSSLAGLALGSFAAFLHPLSSTQAGILGFIIGLIAGSFFISRFFRQKKNKLYPVIIKITKKGDSHG